MSEPIFITTAVQTSKGSISSKATVSMDVVKYDQVELAPGGSHEVKLRGESCKLVLVQSDKPCKVTMGDKVVELKGKDGGHLPLYVHAADCCCECKGCCPKPAVAVSVDEDAKKSVKVSILLCK